MQEQNIIFFLIASTVALMIISAGLIIFVAWFMQSKKNTLIKEQRQRLRYEQDLAHTKTEVQANTLSYISKELHDNVGQLLAIAKRYSGQLRKKVGSDVLDPLDDVLRQTASEVRHISHSLSQQNQSNFDLRTALQNDVARIEKLGLIQFRTDITSYKHALNSNEEIILFRIIQEFIANTLKHSEATTIDLQLKQTSHAFRLSLADNGIGYYMQAYDGVSNGLKNMHARAKMLQASLSLQSEPNKGTTLLLTKTQPTNTEP